MKLSRLAFNSKEIGSFWVAGAAVVGTIGGALISADASKKNAKAASNLQYTPIDLDALQKRAQENAVSNAKKSLEIEQQLTPDLAASRQELQKQVASDLASGGMVPADVANQVTRAAMTGSNSAGFVGGAAPITAATLGMTALDLRNQNQQKALALQQANPLPEAGLSPGDLASAAIGQNNAINQFNASKAGAVANANQSSANAWASGLSSLGGIAESMDRTKSTTQPTTQYTGTGSIYGQKSYAQSTPFLQSTNYSKAPNYSSTGTYTP